MGLVISPVIGIYNLFLALHSCESIYPVNTGEYRFRVFLLQIGKTVSRVSFYCVSVSMDRPCIEGNRV